MANTRTNQKPLRRPLQRRQCVVEMKPEGALLNVRWDDNVMKLGIAPLTLEEAKRYMCHVQIGREESEVIWTQAAGVWYTEVFLTDFAGGRPTQEQIEAYRRAA